MKRVTAKQKKLKDKEAFTDPKAPVPFGFWLYERKSLTKQAKQKPPHIVTCEEATPHTNPAHLCH